MTPEYKKGQNVLVRDTRGLEFRCKIMDIKNSYGNTRYKVAPQSGYGTAWVEKVYMIAVK